MSKKTMTFSVFVLIVLALAGVSGWSIRNAEKVAPMAGDLVDANGSKLHVVDLGPRDSVKPPVVLIHGASVNLLDMKMSLGKDLAADRRVIIIDRPGRGYSERPEGGDQLSVQAQYIRAALSELGVKDPVVVGQSLGGAVALAYALQYQDEMSGLVLLAPVSHEWPGGVAWYNNASGIPGVGFLLRRLVIPLYGTLVARNSVIDSFKPNHPPDNYYERSGLALLFRAKDFRANAADVAALKREIKKQQHRYDELAIPVAIVVGDADTTVSPEIHSRTLAGQVDGAELTVLPGTGHALHHAETAKILNVINGLSRKPESA